MLRQENTRQQQENRSSHDIDDSQKAILPTNPARRTDDNSLASPVGNDLEIRIDCHGVDAGREG